MSHADAEAAVLRVALGVTDVEPTPAIHGYPQLLSVREADEAPCLITIPQQSKVFHELRVAPLPGVAEPRLAVANAVLGNIEQTPHVNWLRPLLRRARRARWCDRRSRQRWLHLRPSVL
jgi:hypothetical protein